MEICTKMMVSGLPAVNISSRLKLQPWQAAKVNVICTESICWELICVSTCSSFRANHAASCFRSDLQRFIDIFLDLIC